MKSLLERASFSLPKIKNGVLKVFLTQSSEVKSFDEVEVSSRKWKERERGQVVLLYLLTSIILFLPFTK